VRRRRIGDAADRRKIKVLLKKNNPGWKQNRLVAMKMAFFPDNPVAFLPFSEKEEPVSSRLTGSCLNGGIDET
jgi:hypothetical protein